METFIPVIIFLVIYIFIVKTVLRGFNNSRGFLPTLFWGLLFLGTLSFLFGGSSNSSSNDGGGYEDDWWWDNQSCDNDDYDYSCDWDD